MTTTPRFPNVHVRLSGHDGNVFSIMGRVRRALVKAGASEDDLKSFMSQMMTASSYDHALQIVMQWVDVS